MDNKTNILIIDDDPVNNFICREIIRMTAPELEVKDFTKPETALQHIEKKCLGLEKNARTVLLLDLNMNVMTGWEFLTEFEKYEDRITHRFDVFILSSSLDESDRQQAKEIPVVKGFITKPLQVSLVEEILKFSE
jgi:CheY-like chemotaxis protein